MSVFNKELRTYFTNLLSYALLGKNWVVIIIDAYF